MAACAIALGAMWLVRRRGRVEWYTGFHAWMSELGVASWARNLDSAVLMLLAGVAIWAVLRAIGPRRDGTILTDLGMAGGPGWLWRGLGVGAVIGLPMLAFALVFALLDGGPSALTWSSINGLVAAPIGEEFVFRGVLVCSVWRIAGSPFWLPAIAAGLAFGVAHVSWTAEGWVSGWFNAVPTAVGGVWYAWLVRRWGEHWGGVRRGNIFVVMSLHAMMNLSWLVMSAQGGAAGGLWPNVARGLTIVLGVVWTLRATGSGRR